MSENASILVVGGEASADEHGAKVLEALKRIRPNVEVFGVGGPAMREQGMTAIADAEKMAVGGITEVLFALPRVWGIFRRLVSAACR